jgi:UDP-hydrolysing UDP-N-acetyl-D-glucosamine 2-epimerase
VIFKVNRGGVEKNKGLIEILDNLKIEKLGVQQETDDLTGMARNIGDYIKGFAEIFERTKPDLIFVEGDRGESLAAAMAGAHMNIPIVHHGGGDLSGSIDDRTRNAITSFSDYHLAGNRKSYNRLRRFKGSFKNIFLVGEPGLDDIYDGSYTPREEIIQRYGIQPIESLILLLQHPNTEEFLTVKNQIVETLEAISALNLQTVAVYSNSDAGGSIINHMIDEYSRKNNKIKVYPNIEREDFLGLMNVAAVMVGNSSSGIIELPSFSKPFVLVGTRQKRRLEAGNVIRVNYNKDEIMNGIRKAIYDEKFKRKLLKIKNPYAFGRSSDIIVKKIIHILENN